MNLMVVFYYVPNNNTFIVTDAFCYPRQDNVPSIEFAYRIQKPYTVDGTVRYVEQYSWAGSYLSGSVKAGDTAMAPNMETPFAVFDRCRIRIRAQAGGAGTGKAIGYFKGYLTDEKS